MGAASALHRAGGGRSTSVVGERRISERSAARGAGGRPEGPGGAGTRRARRARGTAGPAADARRGARGAGVNPGARFFWWETGRPRGLAGALVGVEGASGSGFE